MGILCMIEYDIYVGKNVYYHPPEGGDPVPVHVDHIWPGMGGPGKPPGVNVSNGKTSVPHHSQVPEARGHYWTFTGKPEHVAMLSASLTEPE